MVSSVMTSTNLFLTPATTERTHHALMTPLPLPMEVKALKKAICETHHSKTFHFSLLHLRKMVVPPVEIPSNYKKMRMLKVSGVDVPFTRKQFERRKRDTRPPRHCRLKTIRE